MLKLGDFKKKIIDMHLAAYGIERAFPRRTDHPAPESGVAEEAAGEPGWKPSRRGRSGQCIRRCCCQSAPPAKRNIIYQICYCSIVCTLSKESLF